MFPVHVALRLRPTQHLVHASTDCVFNGDRGHYRVDDEPDADDPYGFSKRLGEVVADRRNVTVIRVSVVGPENRTDPRGLLGWFLRQPVEVDVQGFTNWRWNGVTTLEWSSIALELVERRSHGDAIASIVQPGVAPMSKYDLLVAFREAYNTSHRIVPVQAPLAHDRTLVPTEERAPIAEQLARLRDWYATAVPC
jgi:dTDP-4-dehydrorhamnose reductase